MRRVRTWIAVAAAMSAAAACSSPANPGADGLGTTGTGAGTGGGSDGGSIPSTPIAALRKLVLPTGERPPTDSTNRYADDPRAIALGHKFFFDTRFSGPLLDEANIDGGSLGLPGETGKVACVSCHVPDRGFVDTRSARGQLSFASGWTRRKSPTVLDLAQATLITWDGRRDTHYSQAFGPILSALEFNSSPLFVAQQIALLYRTEYETVFGRMPDLGSYPALTASSSGCTSMPDDPVHGTCPQAGGNDDAIVRVIVNFGKAISAYERQLTCGRSRFDAWMDGDESAMNADEKAGALLFVGKAACDGCHSGPHMSDQAFHNVGTPANIGEYSTTGFFADDDPGQAAAVAPLLADRLNSKGAYSDGYDGRLDRLPQDPSTKLGAFRTPTLRCVGDHPSFMHNATFRSLEDVVTFFSDGGSGLRVFLPNGDSAPGFVGTSEIHAVNLTDQEQAQLVAFLRTLEGPGPDATLRQTPELPH